MSQNPLEPLRLYRVNTTSPDPAIDQEACTVEQIRAYHETRDPAALPLLEGKVPVWFVVKRLPALYLTRKLVPLGDAERQVLAFRAACHRVEHEGDEALVCHDPEGAPKGARFVGTAVEHGVVLAPETWVQEVADLYGADTIREIGQAACDHARLPLVRHGGFRWWGG